MRTFGHRYVCDLCRSSWWVYSADMPMARLSQTDAHSGASSSIDGMAGMPEEATATAAHADDVAYNRRNKDEVFVP
jgi:hypothetical protein